jgi:cell wall-associated NlpC family hydrolase
MPRLKKTPKRRTLRLTSPYTKGHDVLVLQKALNKRSKARKLKAIVEDGEYGPGTAHRVSQITWLLGLDKTNVATPHIQRVIRHPELRTPVELARAAKRKKQWEQSHKSVDAVVQWCMQQVGKHEDGYSNRGEWLDQLERDFHILGVAWCGIFVGYALRHIAGIQVPDGMMYTPNIIGYAKAGTNGFEGWYPWEQRQRGDLVLMKFPGVSNAPCDHVGLYIGGEVTVEGNTSSTDHGSQNNGGSVALKRRPAAVIVGCARPRYQH